MEVAATTPSMSPPRGTESGWRGSQVGRGLETSPHGKQGRSQRDCSLQLLKRLFYVVPECEAMIGSYRKMDQWVNGLVQPCDMREESAFLEQVAGGSVSCRAWCLGPTSNL